MIVPGLRFMQGRNAYSDADGRKYGVAIHATANDASADGEAAYATRRTDGVSAHFFADSVEVVQSLDTRVRAGHAGSREGNDHAIAFEITGGNDKTRGWWLANVCWLELGRVIAWLIVRGAVEPGFEVRRATVAEMQMRPTVGALYGHNDMRIAWGGTTHTDPGPNFPWDRLIAAVDAALEDEMALTADDAAMLWKADVVPAVFGELGNPDQETNRTWRALYALGDVARTGREAVALARANAARLDALSAVVAEIAAAGTSVDTAAVLAAVDRVGERAAVEREALAGQVAALTAELEDRDRRLAEALAGK